MAKKFPFHYGAIETKKQNKKGLKDDIFPFHYGAIETKKAKKNSLRLTTLNFHSTMVRLKLAFFYFKDFVVNGDISIPLWCD